MALTDPPASVLQFRNVKCVVVCLVHAYNSRDTPLACTRIGTPFVRVPHDVTAVQAPRRWGKEQPSPSESDQLVRRRIRWFSLNERKMSVYATRWLPNATAVVIVLYIPIPG